MEVRAAEVQTNVFKNSATSKELWKLALEVGISMDEYDDYFELFDGSDTNSELVTEGIK